MRIESSRCTISRWPMGRVSSSADRTCWPTTTAGSIRRPSRSTRSNLCVSRASRRAPAAERPDRAQSRGADSMRALALVCAALIAAEGEGSPSSIAPADRAAYEAARAKAGHDAQAQVRLALWCEAHGLSAERMKHLAMAVLYDPSNALARGLLGLVADQGKWERPEVVGRRIEDDPAARALVREYLDRRAQTPLKPDAQSRLAAWCEQNGLREQAIAHSSDVVRADPSGEATWRHLGYKKQADRWVKAEDLAAEKLEAERQKHADKQWRLRLERLREWLEGKDAARRAKAEKAISEVTDPRAVPMIWAVFLRGS